MIDENELMGTEEDGIGPLATTCNLTTFMHTTTKE
jgi:hypothetical protein